MKERRKQQEKEINQWKKQTNNGGINWWREIEKRTKGNKCTKQKELEKINKEWMNSEWKRNDRTKQGKEKKRKTYWNK